MKKRQLHHGDTETCKRNVTLPASALRPVLIVIFLLTFFLSASATSAPSPWSTETLAMAGTIPVLELGRVKPLDTYASFKLLKLRGRRSVKNAEGDKLTPMAWMLDCLFRPGIARQYKVFQINDPEVIQALGLHYDAVRRRGEFSADELEPAAQTLFRAAKQTANIDPAQRTRFQNHIYNLANNYYEFLELTSTLDCGRLFIEPGGGGALASVLPGAGPWRYHEALPAVPELIERYLEIDAKPEKTAEDNAAIDAILGALEQLHGAGEPCNDPALLPMTGAWRAPGALFDDAANGKIDAQTIEWLAGLERLADIGTDAPQFRQALAPLRDSLRRVVFERGEGRRIDLEYFFYRAKFFYWSLILFILAFLVNAALWMRPNSRVLARLAFASVLAPELLLCVGIVVRCVVRGRPPITNLYETTLFIPAVAIAAALVMETINRRRIAMGVAAAFGAVAMFVSNRYEIKDGLDTMESLRAVLDTNFWLATHVTTVTMGYSAGLLAGALAGIYLVAQALGLGRPAMRHSIARMVYGAVCFGTFFALAGTILGGLWANDSWGRFWGWDPKENGALLIILWNLAILHAWWGGHIQRAGLCALSVLGAMVVSISWWGVNLMGVGLHSYGFTSGILRNLAIFWGICLAVSALGPAARARERTEAFAALTNSSEAHRKP